MIRKTATWPDKSTNKQTEPTIGIITALPKEYDAVRALLEYPEDCVVEGKGAGRRYLLGEIPATKGSKHTVVLSLADMGIGMAATRATLLLQHFPEIKFLIMVGIAGGIPNPTKPDDHVRLGDVVVSDQWGVVQFDFVKVTSARIDYRPFPRPPSATLLEAVKLLTTAGHQGHLHWVKYIRRAMTKLRVSHPSVADDILASSTNSGQSVPHPQDPKREEGYPRIFIGTIGSSNTLLMDPNKRDELRDRFGVKAIEMEGAGIADATWNKEVGYLDIRGICDYCDSNKNDTWQEYAAITAAAYMRALLESMPGQRIDQKNITCFISHSWASYEHDFAIELAAALELHGIATRPDPRTVFSGGYHNDQIIRDISTCDVFLPVMAPAAVISPQSSLELEAALKQRSEQGIQIIPLVLQDCASPQELKNLRSFDFRDETRYWESLQPLLASIEHAHLIRSTVHKVLNGDDEMRFKAAQDLWVLQECSTVPILIRCLQVEHIPTIRYWLACTLGRIGGKRALVALQKAKEQETDLFALQGITEGLKIAKNAYGNCDEGR